MRSVFEWTFSRDTSILRQGVGNRCDTVLWGDVARHSCDISKIAGIFRDSVCATLCRTTAVTANVCQSTNAPLSPKHRKKQDTRLSNEIRTVWFQKVQGIVSILLHPERDQNEIRTRCRFAGPKTHMLMSFWVHQVSRFFCDCDCDFLSQVKKTQRFFWASKVPSPPPKKALRFILATEYRKRLRLCVRFSWDSAKRVPTAVWLATGRLRPKIEAICDCDSWCS